MEHYSQAPEGYDPKLWEIARKRASFKSNLITYFIINTFLWALWYLTGGRTYSGGLPWPVWPTFGWGIGLAFHYFGAYVNPENTSTENEYEKLKRKQQ